MVEIDKFLENSSFDDEITPKQRSHVTRRLSEVDAKNDESPKTELNQSDSFYNKVNWFKKKFDHLNINSFFSTLVISQTTDAAWTIKDIVWKNVLFFVYLHLGSFYGFYLIFTGQCKIATILMCMFYELHCSLFWIQFLMKFFFFKAILLIHWGLLGITAGAHRLWSHKGYKAKWQLKLLLTFFNTIAHQNGELQ